MAPSVFPTRAASSVVILLCCASLAAWAFDVEVARRAFPAMVPMNPMTAVALLIGAVALLLRTERRRGITRAVGWCIALLGGLRLADSVLGAHLGVDQLLFPAKLVRYGGHLANRMAPLTAVDLVLIGAALGLVDVGPWRRTRPTTALALIALALSASPLVPYLGRLAARASAAAGSPPFPLGRTLSASLLALALLLLPERSE